jgi:hypothetical protein
MLENVQYLYGVPWTHDRAFLSHECEACTLCTGRVAMKKEIPTLVIFTKSTTYGCSREDKNFGELDPSATTHPQMEAPSFRGGSQVGTPQNQELKVQKDHLSPQYG